MASSQATADGASPRTPLAMRARLSAMIFLQYWPLGVWAVTAPTYIARNTGAEGDGMFTPWAIGAVFASGAIGSLVSPAVFGWVADRFFAAERVLAALHAAAAGVLWIMCVTDDGTTFVVACLVYYHLYIPTVALTTTICLRNLRDVEAEFPAVRVFATIAWILGGWFIGLAWPLAFGVNIEPTTVPLMIGAVSGLVMAAYSVTLPHTPPAAAAIAYGGAEERRGLWRNRAFVAFLVVSVFACAPSQAYNLANTFLNEQGYAYAATKLTLGQASEIVCMLLMPALLASFGMKRLFVLGVLVWGIRYLMLAFGGAWGWPSAIYLAIAIHGPSYAFVYVAGQLYIDRLVPTSQRGAAQGWHTAASSGLGHLIGAFVVAQAQVAYLTPPGVSPPPYRWFEFWVTPAVLSFFAAALAAIVIRSGDGQRRPPQYHATDAPPSPADALTEPPHA